jgi:hypothetical protein
MHQNRRGRDDLGGNSPIACDSRKTSPSKTLRSGNSNYYIHQLSQGDAWGHKYVVVLSIYISSCELT